MIFKTKLIDINKSYNFSDYFNLRIKRDKLLAFFGYKLINQRDIFKNVEPFSANIDSLRESLIDMMDRVIFDSEIARRELLIAPIVLRLMKEFKTIHLSIEEKIEFNNLLKGKLDYFLSTQNNLLVIEAKNQNLDSAINQLAVEMITLDKIFEEENIETKIIYGAISTGIEWKFLVLDRAKQEFCYDHKIYLLPDDLAIIMGIFVQILDLKKGD